MVLYGMYSGGVLRCSGTTKAGKPCGRQGYTTNRQYGYWCHLHNPNHHQMHGSANAVTPEKSGN